MTAEMMQEAVEAMKAHGSQVKAAQAMNLSRAALQSRLINAGIKNPIMMLYGEWTVVTLDDILKLEDDFWFNTSAA